MKEKLKFNFVASEVQWKYLLLCTSDIPDYATSEQKHLEE